MSIIGPSSGRQVAHRTAFLPWFPCRHDQRWPSLTNDVGHQYANEDPARHASGHADRLSGYPHLKGNVPNPILLLQDFCGRSLRVVWDGVELATPSPFALSSASWLALRAAAPPRDGRRLHAAVALEAALALPLPYPPYATRPVHNCPAQPGLRARSRVRSADGDERWPRGGCHPRPCPPRHAAHASPVGGSRLSRHGSRVRRRRCGSRHSGRRWQCFNVVFVRTARGELRRGFNGDSGGGLGAGGALPEGWPLRANRAGGSGGHARVPAAARHPVPSAAGERRRGCGRCCPLRLERLPSALPRHGDVRLPRSLQSALAVRGRPGRHRAPSVRSRPARRLRVGGRPRARWCHRRPLWRELECAREQPRARRVRIHMLRAASVYAPTGRRGRRWGHTAGVQGGGGVVSGGVVSGGVVGGGVASLSCARPMGRRHSRTSRTITAAPDLSVHRWRAAVAVD